MTDLEMGLFFGLILGICIGLFVGIVLCDENDLCEPEEL